MPIRFDVQVVDSTGAAALMERRKISAAVRIPGGFTEQLLDQKPTYLEVVSNPAQGIYPQIVEGYVGVLAQLGSAAFRVLGEPIGEIQSIIETQEGPTDEVVFGISRMMNRKMTSVGKYAFPPMIALEQGSKEEGEGKAREFSAMQIATFALPGMAIFSLLMLAIVAMSDLQRERARQTLARQFVAPIRYGSVILGKIGAVWVLSLICVIILVLLACVVAKVRISIPGFLAVSCAFALTATGLAVFMQSLSRSERAGSAIGSILVMIISMVGGSWVPLSMMPEFVRKIAPFTPTYWGGEGYRKLMFESAGVGDLLGYLGLLVGFGLVLMLIAIARIRKLYAAGV
jgi:ABC-2 type transport system permease protein